MNNMILNDKFMMTLSSEYSMHIYEMAFSWSCPYIICLQMKKTIKHNGAFSHIVAS